jgi:hypothetical protein
MVFHFRLETFLALVGRREFRDRTGDEDFALAADRLGERTSGDPTAEARSRPR